MGVNPSYINSSIVNDAVLDAYGVLKRSNHRDAFITHLHYDHYSLLPKFAVNLPIHVVYLPAIPRIPLPERIVDGLYYLLAFLIVMRIKGAVVIKDILESGQMLTLSRGDIIEFQGGMRAEVLWPPSRLPEEMAQRLKRKLMKIYRTLERMAEQRNVWDELRIFAKEKIEKLLVAQKERDLERVIRDGEISSGRSSIIWSSSEQLNQRDAADEKIEKILKVLKDVANSFSLVLKFHYPCKGSYKAIALILGDASEDVLNHLAQLQASEPVAHKCVVFLRASHHGTYCGEYLEEHRRAVTWISWTAKFYRNYRSFPALQYWLNSDFTFLAEFIRKLEVRIHGD